MKDFNYWKQLHEKESLEEFNSDPVGLLWLKIKSIIRTELIKEFIEENNIKLRETAIVKQFTELFELLSLNANDSHHIINRYIKTKNQAQAANLNVDKIVSELYKLQNFKWGGDYQNSLDKYLVTV